MFSPFLLIFFRMERLRNSFSIFLFECVLSRKQLLFLKAEYYVFILYSIVFPLGFQMDFIITLIILIILQLYI